MLRDILDLGVRAVALLAREPPAAALRRILGWLCRAVKPTLSSFRRPALGLVSPARRGTQIEVMRGVPWAGGSTWRVRAPPRRAPPRVQALHVHGGGLVGGDAWAFRGFCSQLSHALGGADVYCPNYRLVPEHTVRDAVDDIVATLAWMAARAPHLPIVCTADSGGAMALLPALGRPHAAARGVRRAALLSPMVDYRFRAPRPPPAHVDDPVCVPALLEWCCALCRRRSGGEENPLEADMTKLAPHLELWVWTDTSEYLCPGARALVARARGAGRRARLREVSGALHAWPVLCALRSVPRLRDDVATLAAFLRRAAGEP